MATDRPKLTAQVVQQICGYIKAGAYEQTACESVGIPHEVFQEWLAQGRRKNAGTIYVLLDREVRQARAQARLKLEMQMREKDPRQWLLHGPGKETPDSPGWSAAPRASTDNPADAPLSDRLYEMIVAIYQALKPFPEARAALEPVVAKFYPGTSLPE